MIFILITVSIKKDLISVSYRPYFIETYFIETYFIETYFF